MRRTYSFQYTKVANEAKRANTRLRALEKAGYTDLASYANVKRLSFDNSHSISYTKKGEIKFRTDVSRMNESELKEHQRIIEEFLNSKSSKVSEINSRRKKAWENWKKEQERQGKEVKMDVKEFSEFWTKSIIMKLKEAYGSDEVQSLVDEYGEASVIEVVQDMLKKGLNPYGDIKELREKLDNFNANKKKG